MAAKTHRPSLKSDLPRVGAEAPEERLFLGSFYFDQPGEPEWNGTFNMVVHAPDVEAALDKFRRHLRRLRTSSSLFDEPVTIYLDGVVSLSGRFKRPILSGYVSRNSAHGGEISCLLPEGDMDGVAGFGLVDEENEDPKGKEIEPFVDFGGFAFRKAVEVVRKGNGSSAPPGPSRRGPLPQR